MFIFVSEKLHLSNSKTLVKYKYIRVLGFPLNNFVELEDFSEKIKLAPSPQGIEVTDGVENIKREQFVCTVLPLLLTVLD